MWQQWVNLVLGLWVILSGYLGMSATAVATNFTISGLLIVAFALWGALQYRSSDTYQTRRHA